MPGSLPVLSEPRPAAKRKHVARGTSTTSVQDRQIRLHPAGARPWLGREGDHRADVNVEIHDGTYVVYRPSIGALSALNESDLVAFHVFLAAPGGERAALARYFAQIGESEEEAASHAAHFAERLMREGWTRTEAPHDHEQPLASVYFTVTRWCDRGCPYCYQGLADRVNTDMPVDKADLVLDRIRAVNPDCQINVTGGEPFSHEHIFEILELLEAKRLKFVILTNGTYIDEQVARRLKRLEQFRYIQISLDGISPETHEMTRGKGHFAKVRSAIQNVIDQGLPFVLAPTLHDRNVHELPAIGELAVANGGWLSPNQLKELPHAGLDYTQISLSTPALQQALREVNDHLVGKFGLDRIGELSAIYASPEVCSVAAPNSTFICGMAHSLMDVDWNGDVYPCHLSKDEKLLIGNIFQEDFPAIFRRVEERGMRVKSQDIEKCSGCKFVSNCAGGCRAGAWFVYGTLEHEDELCDLNYSSHLRRLLVGAGVS